LAAFFARDRATRPLPFQRTKKKKEGKEKYEKRVENRGNKMDGGRGETRKSPRERKGRGGKRRGEGGKERGGEKGGGGEGLRDLRHPLRPSQALVLNRDDASIVRASIWRR